MCSAMLCCHISALPEEAAQDLGAQKMQSGDPSIYAKGHLMKGWPDGSIGGNDFISALSLTS